MEKMIGKIDRETKKHIDNISDIIGANINNAIERNESIKKIPDLCHDFNELKVKIQEEIIAKIDELMDRLEKIEGYLVDEDNHQYLTQAKEIIEQIGNNWINE
ncbi:MAG TPA: hypothetical protein PK816_16820 [Candidatus Cloacimonadota bacterium]|nr:hypothetical protein [Candidatus Cloacimonadota bacterium]